MRQVDLSIRNTVKHRILCAMRIADQALERTEDSRYQAACIMGSAAARLWDDSTMFSKL